MKGKLLLNKKSVHRLLYYQVLYVFFLRFCVDVLHFPSMVSYGIDVINLLVTAFFLYSKQAKKKIVLAGMTPVLFSVIALIAFTVADGMINLVQPQLYLWAFRNTMRYYPFFFSIIALWDEEMLDCIIKFLVRLQYPNFLIVLFQYFVLGYQQDNIGGIFGCVAGCNGALNIYLCIAAALCIEKYLHKEMEMISLLISLLMFLICIVLAEIKVGFIELPMIVALAVILNRPSFKTVIITLFIVLMIPIGLQAMVALFPWWARSIVSIGAFLGTGSEVGGGYNISRLGAFSDINRLFFQNDLIKNAFGLGFGNCEYSSVSFFSSSFYKSYGWLNYRWFAHQMWFLECGYFGISFYALFFVTLFFWFTRQKKKMGDSKGMGAFGLIMIAICALNFIYNCTLRTEDGYMLYLALALPCLYYRCLNEKEKTKSLRNKY